MGAKGSNTTTETKSYQADPRAAAYAQWMTGQAQNLPGAGAVPLQGVEGFSSDQLAAFQGVRGAQGMYNPYAQRAEALNAEFGRGLNTAGVQDMYSQLSAGPLAQLANQQRAQMAQGTRNAVQAAGGTGASRIGVAQGNIANQQNLATGALQSGLLGQSINAYQQDLAMKGAAAAQEANLGMGHTGQTYNDLGQLYGIGSAQQGLGQAGLNALYQQGMGQYQNPYMNYQMQSGLLGQLGNIFRGTETTTKEVPEASPWGTILGAAGAAAGAYFGGPAGAQIGGSLGKGMGGGGAYLPNSNQAGPNPNVPGGYNYGGRQFAAGGAVNPYAGGQRSGLFDQMVKQYFPKNNPMTGMGAATTKAGGPFNGLVSQNATMGFADGGEVDDFDTRFGNIPAPDLYDADVAANRNALRDAGYNSPYRMEPMSEGDDVAPPLPPARPPFEMFPNRNPLQVRPDTEERLAYADEGGGGSMPAGGRQLPPMPDTEFQAPQRNPWGAVINAAAAALSKHGERTPSGHLMSGTVFGQAARAAGAGLEAGMKTHAAGREEDRKNYEMRLRGEVLANQAAMQRLPYEQLTEAQKLEALKPFKIGTDPTSFIDIYGVRNPETGEIRRIDPTTGQFVAEGQSPFVGGGATGEEYLKTIDPKVAAQVRAINEGRIAPPAANSRAPQARMLLNHLYAAYPEADTTVWKSRNETRAAFSKGVEGRAVTSLNTVMGHLNDLKETTERLSGKNVKAWNRIENAIKDQFGQDALADYRVARTAVGDELARVFQGAGVAAESEKQRWLEALDAANSPAQFKRVVGRLASLIQSRMSALEAQYDRGMNYEPGSDKSIAKKGFLDPGAKEKYEGIKKWSSEAGGPKSGPAVGTERGGYRFKGGDPSKKENWEKI